MARVYISSTFEDLKEARERVGKQLQDFGHQPRGMETSPAEDLRPLAAVRQDVESCDVYVGIFAFRYGYQPTDAENVDRKSITELELEHARSLGMPVLVFVLKEGSSWPTNMLDSQQPGDDKGKRIAALRARLLEGNVAGIFATIGELEGKVAAAVTRAVGGSTPGQAVKYSRQIHRHLLVLSAPTDDALAKEWVAALTRLGLSATVDSQSLLASNARDLVELDGLLASHHGVLVPLTPAVQGLVKSHGEKVRRALDMAAARTGCLIAAVDEGLDAAAEPGVWMIPSPGLAGLPSATSGQLKGIFDALDAACPDWQHPVVVGLPYSVLAMTHEDAEELAKDPAAAARTLPRQYEEQFTSLWQSVVAAPGGWEARYRAERTSWRPLGGQMSIAEVLQDITARLNGGLSGPRDDCRIRLQYYPFIPEQKKDPATGQAPKPDLDLRAVYAAVERSGCVAIVDELSIFHPRLRRPALSVLSERQVAVITVAPSTPAQSQIEELLECEARKALTLPYTRFDEECDPQCELGVGGERQLRRALHRSLPDTVQRIRQPGIDRDKRSSFRAEVASPGRMADVIFPRRAGR
jgi:hypothetical protein